MSRRFLSSLWRAPFIGILLRGSIVIASIIATAVALMSWFDLTASEASSVLLVLVFSLAVALLFGGIWKVFEDD